MTLGLMESDVVSCVSAFLPWEPDFLIRVTLLAAGILLAGALIGRRRPAVRHLVTSIGLGCLLLLGLLSLRMPSQGYLVRTAIAIWGTVAVALILRLLLDLAMVTWQVTFGTRPAAEAMCLRTRHLGRQVGLRRQVKVLLGDAACLPHVWGLLHPAIILPRQAITWSAERLDAVLLHELGHIRRHDGLSILIARLAGAVYWFHPMVWLLLRRTREDAERACDALAIEHGMPAIRYARHLLAIVRDVRRQPAFLAPSMAAKSDLAGRINALLALHPAAAGRAVSRVGRLTASGLVVILVVPTLLLARDSAPQTEIHPAKGSLAACFTAPGVTDLTGDLASEEVSFVVPQHDDH